MNILDLVLSLSLYTAHSWLDCISTSFDKQTPYPQLYSVDEIKHICNGFPRNYPGRNVGEIGPLYTHLMERREPTNKLCSTAQSNKRSVNDYYTSEFPMIKANSGDRLKLWWESDGHYRDTNPTQVYVYATKISSITATEGLQVYQDMNKAVLVGQMDFATVNNCYDKSSNSLCWGSISIPKEFTKGIYKFVWNWVYDSNPVGEEYSTCFDAEITDSENKQPVVIPNNNNTILSHKPKCRSRHQPY